MKNTSHQPKALAIGIALVLGFTVLGAGCSQQPGANDEAAPSTALTTTPPTMPGASPATMPPQPAASAPESGTQGNAAVQEDNGSIQNGDAAMDEDHGLMQAGSGDSQSPVSDTWITTKVRAKLHTIDGLDNSDISVETNNGVVVLSGHVASQDQLDTAVSAVKTIEGVKDVDTSMLETGADTGQ